MKAMTVVVLMAVVLAVCTAQAPGFGQGSTNAQPNLMNFMMYRNFLDMNPFSSLLLSGGLGGAGAGGMGAGGMGIMPWLFAFN